MVKRKYKYKRKFDDGGGIGASISSLGGSESLNLNLDDALSNFNLELPSLGGSGSSSGLSSLLKSDGAGSMANSVASGLNSLMNPSGNSTGVGNALSTIGSAASNIPGVGGLIGAGVNLVGGLVNAAFGSNLNEEFINQTEDQTKQQASYTSSAKDNASLLSDWSSYTDMAHVSQDDVGSDGWFSDKAKDKTKELNDAIDKANFRAWKSLSNTASNVDRNNDMLALANYSAYGGPISMNYSGVMSPFGSQYYNNGGYLNGGFNRSKHYPYGGYTNQISRKFFDGGDSESSTPIGRIVPKEYQDVANLAWAAGELIPGLGSVLGVADVANDLYNMANSESVGWNDLANLGLDIAGLLPGFGTLTKAAKLARKAKATKAADKLEKAAESLRFSSSSGTKQIKESVQKAKKQNRRTGKELSRAAAEIDTPILQKYHGNTISRAHESTSLTNKVLGQVDDALSPIATRYNNFRIGAITADSANDAFNLANTMNEYSDGGNFSNSNFTNNSIVKGISSALQGLSTATGGEDQALQNSLGRNTGSGAYGIASTAGMGTYDIINSIRNLTKSKREPLSKVIGLYADGGDMGSSSSSLGNYLGIAESAVKLIANGINEANNLVDTESIEDDVKSYGDTNSQFSGSNDDLLNQWGNVKLLNSDISYRDIRDKSYFDDFLTSVPASFEGFNAGSSFGPWGAAIGGVVGGASSVAGSIVGRKKAEKEAEELSELVKDTNNRILMSFNNAVNNNKKAQKFNMERTYFGEGGSIHIKPENRGKFTALKERTGKSATWFKEHGTPAQKKMATFALNARKWKHKDGGPLFTHGGIFSNGITEIDEGGTHEENPFEGIQVGVDPEGIPNLVEEGEVIFNDYVFSNRIKVPKDVKKELKVKGDTFADAAKNAQKESAERPNDPISKKGLEDSMSKLMMAQESERMKKQAKENMKAYKEFARGGKLGNLFDGEGDSPNWRNNLWYNNAVKYSGTPYDDSDQLRWSGIVTNANGNVDWGQTYDPLSNFSALRNYYKTNWDNPEFAPYKQAYLGRLSKSNSNMSNLDAFTLDDFLEMTSDKKLGAAHMLDPTGEISKMASPINYAASISETPTLSINEELLNKEYTPFEIEASKIVEKSKNKKNKVKGPKNKTNLSYLRYAPALMSGTAAIADVFSKPDYSAADRVASVNIQPALVNADPVGQYLAYKPFDRMFYINQLNKSSAASRRAAQNFSGGNRASALAGMLAADYNYGTNLGKLAREAEEYNFNRRKDVATFNRDTDKFNSTQSLQAQTANQQSRNLATQLRLQQAEKVADFRQKAKDAYDTRRSNNLNNFINNLGNIGWEETQAGWLDNLAKRGVLLMDTKGNYTGGSGNTTTKATGGKLKRRKRRII